MVLHFLISGYSILSLKLAIDNLSYQIMGKKAYLIITLSSFNEQNYITVLAYICIPVQSNLFNNKLNKWITSKFHFNFVLSNLVRRRFECMNIMTRP